MTPDSPQPAPSRPSSFRPTLAAFFVCALFFVSGSAGLIYQVAWNHIFTTVFGSTTYAVSVVISVFMAGLALGSFALGRVADRARRHLLIYALLEVGIALSALLVVPALGLAEGLYGAVFRASGSPALLTLVQVVVSALILIVPTFLMGGTLPVLSRYLARRRRVVGSAVGILYGLNTLGAAAGAFLTGFVFIRLWGTQAAIYLAVVANLGLAVAFVGLHALAGRGEAAVDEPADEPAVEPALGRARLGLLLTAVAVSGFVSFSYEVLWTRLLALVFETTVHAFSVMLTTFLLGLGLGGALAGVLMRGGAKRGYWRLYGYLEALIGLCGLASIPLFLPPPFGYSSFAELTLLQFVRSAMIMIVPTTLMGAAFPIACHLYAAGVRKTGESVGRIYLANTVGAVSGALLTGFYLIRVLGSQGSLVFGSLLIVVSGALVVAASPRAPAPAGRPRKALPPSLVSALILVAVALGVWALIPPGMVLRYQVLCHAVGYGDRDLDLKVLGYDEGVEGSVIVLRHPDGTKLLSVGTTIVAGTDLDQRTTQKLQGHVPMLLRPDAKDVCQVGLGSGETARVFSSYDLDRFDCVEISRSVVRMAATQFADINGGVVASPAFQPIIMDASAYLKYTDRRYDIIANDANWPHTTGASMLYTREHFEHCRSRLKKGGIMTSWLPLEMPRQDLKTVFRTFSDVFPYVYVWSPLSHGNKHALIIGCMEPLRLDAQRYVERFNRFARRELASVKLGSPLGLLASHLAAFTGGEQDLKDVPLNTQDRPTLRYLAMRPDEYGPDIGDKQVVQSLMFLAEHRDRIEDHLENVQGLKSPDIFMAGLRRMDDASDYLLKAIWEKDRGNADREAIEMGKAMRLAPSHPAFEEVAGTLRKLRSISPEDIRALQTPQLQALVTRLMTPGTCDLALVALEEWARREPDSAVPQAKMGACYFVMDDLEAAKERMGRARELAGTEADFNLAAGTAYLELRQVRRAGPMLSNATRQAPQSPEAWMELGRAYRMAGQSGGALSALTRAVELDPKRAESRFELAALLCDDGRYGEAILHLERLIEVRPDSLRALKLLAEAHRRTGNMEAANRYMLRARQVAARRGSAGAMGGPAPSSAGGPMASRDPAQ